MTKSQSESNGIVYASMALSILSIITSIMAMMDQRNIQRSKHYVSVKFDVTGQVIVVTMKKCKQRYKILQHQISSLLGVNANLIEIVPAAQIKNGLRITINVYITRTKAIDMNIKDDMYSAQQRGKLAEIIKLSWKLSRVPAISNIPE